MFDKIIINKSQFQYILFCSILLFPICYFPYSLDLSVFAMCGKTIAKGGKLYIDAIDIKAPAIYYFFSFIHYFTHSTAIGLRIFDFFWQIATIILLKNLILNSSQNYRASYFAGLAYSLSYTALNYTCTTQVESFIPLPMIIILNLYFNKNRTLLNNLVIGVLFGLVLSLKITFSVILIPFLFDILISEKNLLQSKSKTIIQITIFSLMSFLFTFIPLLDNDVFKAYIVLNKFMIAYISNPQYNLDLVKNFIIQTGSFFGNNYSISFVVLFSFGILYYLNSKGKIQKFLAFNLWLLVLMLICVFVEKKMFTYHYSRVHLFTSIICGFGFSFVFDFVKSNKINFNSLNKIANVFILALFLLLSPFSRYFNLLKPIYLFYTDTYKYYAYFDSKEINNCHLKSEYEITEFIKSGFNQNEKLSVISVGGNTINLMLNNSKYSPLLQSCFYYSETVPKEYQLLFKANLYESKWLVIAKQDIFLFKDKSSWEYLQNDTYNYQYVINNFDLVKELPTYKVFKRK